MKVKNVIIIDYGFGNLKSIQNMLKKIGVEAKISNKKEDIETADKLILPGVGSFATAMNSIDELNLRQSLDKAVLQKKTPILGICLGMQLMCAQSEEGGQITRGLNWINANVRRLPFSINESKLKIPHIGWSSIKNDNQSRFFLKDAVNKFYFVHAYFVELNDEKDLLSHSSYGIEFCSAFQRGNILGVQFHPEKSHKYGLHLLEQFILL